MWWPNFVAAKLDLYSDTEFAKIVFRFVYLPTYIVIYVNYICFITMLIKIIHCLLLSLSKHDFRYNSIQV